MGSPGAGWIVANPHDAIRQSPHQFQQPPGQAPEEAREGKLFEALTQHTLDLRHNLHELRLRVEALPDVSATESLRRLLRDSVAAEERVAAAVGFYNSQASEYNEAIERLPWSLVGERLGHRRAPMWSDRLIGMIALPASDEP